MGSQKVPQDCQKEGERCETGQLAKSDTRDPISEADAR
jgi:hypothetical protein